MNPVKNYLEYQSKIAELKESDYEGALTLLNEIVEKINEIFNSQLKHIESAQEKIKLALGGKGDQTRICRPHSEMEKDCTALSFEREVLLKWQKKYAFFIEGFPYFVIFMKVYHPKIQCNEDFDKEFQEKLAVHYSVFSNFNQLDDFYRESLQADSPFTDTRTRTSWIIQQKFSGLPVSEVLYTQEIANIIAIREAFVPLGIIQGLVRSMHDVTSKTYSWLQRR